MPMTNENEIEKEGGAASEMLKLVLPYISK